MSIPKTYIWLVEGAKHDELIKSLKQMGLRVREDKKIRQTDGYEHSVFSISQREREGQFKFNTYKNDGVVNRLMVTSFFGLDLAKRVCIFLRIPFVDREMCVDYQDAYNQKREKSRKELYKILMPDQYRRYYGVKAMDNYPHLVDENKNTNEADIVSEIVAGIEDVDEEKKQANS